MTTDDIIRSSREYLGRMLKKLPSTLKQAASETAIQIICDEIKKLPIPILPTLLAATVKKMLSSSPGGGYSISDVMQLLSKMETSDEAFQEVLDEMRISLADVHEDIQTLTELVRNQSRPDFRVLNPKVELDHPISENKVRFIFANTGGGTVTVEELYLDVERWEPAAEIDYSVPAAPMAVLFLKAELSVDRAEYPLLALNNEPGRVYNAQGAGAEMVKLSLSSKHNARYWVRLRAPYLDLSTGETQTALYPPEGQDPLLLPFVYAPGWMRIPGPDELLNRPQILENMIRKFNEILTIFRQHNASGATDTEELGNQLSEIHISPYTLPQFLAVFLRVFASIAYLEKQQDALRLILDIMTYFVHPGREFFGQMLTVDEIVKLANNPDVQPLLAALIEEPTVPGRESLTQQILAGVKPIL